MYFYCKKLHLNYWSDQTKEKKKEVCFSYVHVSLMWMIVPEHWGLFWWGER